MAKQRASTENGQPEMKWPKFRPTGYSLNLDAIQKIPIDAVQDPTERGGTSATPMNVFDAFKDLRDLKPHVDDDSPSENLAVQTNEGMKHFSGKDFAVYLLWVLVHLHQDGINPFAARWFFYDQDQLTRDPGKKFAFFVVNDGKIVHERIIFYWHPFPRDERYDLNTILTTTLFGNESEELEPIWANDDDWQDAENHYWYRRFYTETKTGQLMLLRPDEPEIYYSDEGQHPNKQLKWPGLGSLDRRLQRTNILLTLLLVLALIATIAGLWH